jgi:cytochrome c-type biogenesis protein CcmH
MPLAMITKRYLAGLALAGLLLLVSAAAHAVEPDEILADPALEARARALSAELRCLVCQNQSIDDSNAPLAKDLRVIVRERLKAGDSDNAVRAFVVARYGRFVLLKPPLGWDTLMLWLAPFVLLLAIATVIALRLRRRAAVVAPGAIETGLSAEERARLEHVLRQTRD